MSPSHFRQFICMLCAEECVLCMLAFGTSIVLQAKDTSKGDLQGVLWGLTTFLSARRELLPFIQDGNRGCGGRLRYLTSYTF